MTNSLCLLQQVEKNGGWTSDGAKVADAVMLAAVQRVDGAQFVAYTDSASDVWYITQNYDNGGDHKWQAPVRFNTAQAKQMTLTTTAEGVMYLIYRQLNNGICVSRQIGGFDIDPGNWQSETFIGETAQDIAVAVNGDGTLVLVYIDEKNVVRIKGQNKDYSWKPTGPSQWTARQLCICQNKDLRLEIFYVGIDNNIYHIWQTAPATGAWQQSRLSGSAQSLCAAQGSDGTITLFYVGMDGNVYHNTQTAPSASTWGGDLEAFKGIYYQGPCTGVYAVRNADHRIQLYRIGKDGFVYSTWQDTQNGPYVGGNRNPYATQLSGVESQDGTIWLYYVGDPNPAPNAPTLTFAQTETTIASHVVWATAILHQDGSWEYSGHAHQSDESRTQPMAVGIAIKDASNNIYLFAHTGASEAVGSADDWDYTTANTHAQPNAAVAQNWTALQSPQWKFAAAEGGNAAAIGTRVVSDLPAPHGATDMIYSV